MRQTRLFLLVRCFRGRIKNQIVYLKMIFGLYFLFHPIDLIIEEEDLKTKHVHVELRASPPPRLFHPCALQLGAASLLLYWSSHSSGCSEELVLGRCSFTFGGWRRH